MKTALELDPKVKALRDIQATIEELTAEAEAIKDAIKAHMVALEDDELTGTGWKATWHTVTSTRIDTTALKKALPEIAAQYSKTTTTSRFMLA